MVRLVARGLGLALLLALIGAVAGAVIVRTAAHEPAVRHVDPTVAERTGRPNDCLAAPEGTTAAKPDLIVTDAPEAALAAFHAVAVAAPRSAIVAGSVEEGWITYVQRSALMGFPDYVSVKAVPGGIAAWSRARYGYSDMGVNCRRLEAWLAEAGIVIRR